MRILLVLLLAATPVSDLLMLDAPFTRAGLPAGWLVRRVGGAATPSVRLVEADGGRALRFEGRNAAAWFYHPLPAPVTDPMVTLGWQWRVLAAPGQSDLRRRSADDSPLRVFVLFGPLAKLGRGSRGIFYTWGNAEPAMWQAASHLSRDIMVVRLAGREDAGEAWREQRVNPMADYRRFWSDEPGPITTVGLMQDTEQTGGAAAAEVRALGWMTEAPTAMGGEQ